MKIDIGQLVNVIGVAMNAVEKIKSAKGKEKEAAVIETVQQSVPQLEAITGVDFVNDPALNALIAQYVAGRVALANGIAAAKALKNQPPANG